MVMKRGKSMVRHVVNADITGTVFKIETSVDTKVETGEPLIILESMKMEIPVAASIAGRVTEILVAEGDAIAEGQALAVIEG